MSKIIFLILTFVILAQSSFLKKKHNSRALSSVITNCSNIIVLSNQNKFIRLFNIQKDNNSVATYADITLKSDHLSTKDLWCKWEDGRIQNIDTELYLNVHGPGRVCWAKDTCEWATQVDAYYTNGSEYFWTDTQIEVEGKELHLLGAMGRSLASYETYVNLAVTDINSKSQQWAFNKYCRNKMYLINFGSNTPLNLIDVVNDSEGNADSGTLSLSATYDHWCWQEEDKKIRHYQTGLCLEVDGSNVGAVECAEGTQWTVTIEQRNSLGYRRLVANGLSLSGAANAVSMSTSIDSTSQLWIFHQQ